MTPLRDLGRRARGGLALRAGLELIEPEDLLRLLHRRGRAPDVTAHPRRDLDELAVRFRHLPAREIEIVFEPCADVPTHRERGRDHPPTGLADADDLPLAAGR